MSNEGFVRNSLLYFQSLWIFGLVVSFCIAGQALAECDDYHLQALSLAEFSAEKMSSILDCIQYFNKEIESHRESRNQTSGDAAEDYLYRVAVDQTIRGLMLIQRDYENLYHREMMTSPSKG